MNLEEEIKEERDKYYIKRLIATVVIGALLLFVLSVKSCIAPDESEAWQSEAEEGSFEEITITTE